MSAHHCTNGPDRKKAKVVCSIPHEVFNVDEEICTGEIEPNKTILQGLLQTDSGPHVVSYVTNGANTLVAYTNTLQTFIMLTVSTMIPRCLLLIWVQLLLSGREKSCRISPAEPVFQLLLDQPLWTALPYRVFLHFRKKNLFNFSGHKIQQSN